MKYIYIGLEINLYLHTTNCDLRVSNRTKHRENSKLRSLEQARNHIALYHMKSSINLT